jgi:hypothetical protein
VKRYVFQSAASICSAFTIKFCEYLETNLFHSKSLYKKNLVLLQEKAKNRKQAGTFLIEGNANHVGKKEVTK